jgi:hypothetical protein
MDVVAANSLAPVRKYALQLFRAKDEQGTNYLLFYFDTIWNCYLCPYSSLQPDQSAPEDVVEPASDRFGLAKYALSAVELDGLEVRHTKESQASHQLNNYWFVFYLIKVASEHEAVFAKRVFEIQGRQYRWMALEEILSNPMSMERNGEVLRYIRDNRQAFFTDEAALSIERRLHE